jgi:hypothetical protein
VVADAIDPLALLDELWRAAWTAGHRAATAATSDAEPDD